MGLPSGPGRQARIRNQSFKDFPWTTFFRLLVFQRRTVFDLMLDLPRLDIPTGDRSSLDSKPYLLGPVDGGK